MNRLRQPGDSDYDVLGISPGATAEEIDRAFRQLIDGEGYRVGVPLNRQWLRAYQIKAAHALLTDPAKRRDYDKSLSQAERALWATRADDPATDELVLPQARPKPARPIESRPAPIALVPRDHARTISGRERAPVKVPGPDAEGRVFEGPPSLDPSPPFNDNEGDSSPAAIDQKPAPARSWTVATALAFGLGLLLIASWQEWDRQPSTSEGTRQVLPDGRQANGDESANEKSTQEVGAIIPRVLSDTQSPAAAKPEGVVPFAKKASPIDERDADARAIAPDQQPPIARTPAINEARVAPVRRRSPIGSAPQWIGGGPTDADNQQGRYQGTVALQVNVAPSGRVSNCAPVRGSGNAGLDALTCRLVRERARFTPALNPRGRPVVGQAYVTFVWERRSGN